MVKKSPTKDGKSQFSKFSFGKKNPRIKNKDRENISTCLYFPLQKHHICQKNGMYPRVEPFTSLGFGSLILCKPGAGENKQFHVVV